MRLNHYTFDILILYEINLIKDNIRLKCQNNKIQRGK